MKALYLLVALICLVSVKSDECQGCAGTSKGVCKSSYNVCYDLDQSTNQCPPGSVSCEGQQDHYSCTDGVCGKNTTGIWMSMKECESACDLCTGCNQASVGNCKDSKNDVCHYYNDEGFCPSGSSYCGTVVVDDKYACDSTSNTCAKSNNGNYVTMDACNTACTVAQKWSCDSSSGICSKDDQGNFDSESACNAGCTASKKWTCTNNACMQDDNGAYDSESACQAGCGGDTVECTGCWPDTKGPCMQDKSTVCREYLDASIKQCWPGSTPCKALEGQFLSL